MTNFLGPVGDVVDAYEFVTAESWAERGELLLDVAVSVVSAPFAAFTAASQRNQTEAHRCELIGSGVCRNLAAFVRENPDATPEAIEQFLDQEAIRVRTEQAERRRQRQQQQQQQQQDPPVEFLPIEELQRFQGGRI